VGAQSRPIACLAWSSAPRHLASRDRYIGRRAEARRRNLGLLAYNTRFLILPWVRVAALPPSRFAAAGSAVPARAKNPPPAEAVLYLLKADPLLPHLASQPFPSVDAI
jgi:hypothetical protein